MSSNGGKNNPGCECKTEPQKEMFKKPKIMPTKVVWVYLLGIICGGICFYGAGFLNAQMFYLGWAIIFIGTFFGCVAVRIWIINHKIKHPMPDWLDSHLTLCVVVTICAIACYLAALISSGKQQPTDTTESNLVASYLAAKPSLSLGVKGKTDLWLTNEQNVVKGFFNAVDFPGLLVLPVNPSQHITKVTFLLRNDTDGTEAKSAEVVFSVTNQSQVFPERTENLNWQIADLDADDGWQHFALLMPNAVPFANTFIMPNLYFQNFDKQLNIPFFTRVILLATGMPRKEIAFWTVFRIETNINYAQFVFRKSVVAAGSNIFNGLYILDDDSPTNHQNH